MQGQSRFFKTADYLIFKVIYSNNALHVIKEESLYNRTCWLVNRDQHVSAHKIFYISKWGDRSQTKHLVILQTPSLDYKLKLLNTLLILLPLVVHLYSQFHFCNSRSILYPTVQIYNLKVKINITTLLSYMEPSIFPFSITYIRPGTLCNG